MKDTEPIANGSAPMPCCLEMAVCYFCSV